MLAVLCARCIASGSKTVSDSETVSSSAETRDYWRLTLNIANFITPAKGSSVIRSVDVDPASTTELKKYFNTAILTHQSGYENWELSKHNPRMKVSDNFAFRSDYRIGEDKHGTVNGVRIYTIVHGTPYIFTFRGSESTYNEYLDDFQDMIRLIRTGPAA